MHKSQKKPILPDVKKPAAKAVKTKDAAKPVSSKPVKLETSTKGTDVKKVARKDSKQDILITLLRRSGGVTVEEMAKATGWQTSGPSLEY